jgi:hypothetical protein
MCSLRSRGDSTARLGGRRRAGCWGVSLGSDDMPKPGEAEAELCRYTRHDLRNAQAHLSLCEEVDRPFEERAKAKAKVAAKLRAWLAAQSALDAFLMRCWRAFRWTAFSCPSPLEILDHGAERQCTAFHGTDQSGQDRLVLHVGVPVLRGSRRQKPNFRLKSASFKSGPSCPGKNPGSSGHRLFVADVSLHHHVATCRGGEHPEGF